MRSGSALPTSRSSRPASTTINRQLGALGRRQLLARVGQRGRVDPGFDAQQVDFAFIRGPAVARAATGPRGRP